MKRRRLVFAWALTALLLGACLAYLRGHRWNQEAKFQEWMAGPTTSDRILSLQRYLSPRVSRVLKLPQLREWFRERHDTMGRNLLASGYITHLTLPTNNGEDWSSQFALRLMQTAHPTVGLWQYSVWNNQVTLTCRTRDVTNILEAIERLRRSPPENPGRQE